LLKKFFIEFVVIKVTYNRVIFT